jgi:hypothetical protein
MMRLERIEDKPESYTGVCIECGEKNLTYIHDLKCMICDNMTIIWCPSCEKHFKVKP